jgi:hypothetical protein
MSKMNFAKFYAITAGIFACLTIGILQPVRADNQITTATYTVPQSAVLPIELRPGLGVNLIYEGVNQMIETIFLDNMSFVSMNHNGCIDKGCPPNSSPTVVHLSSIDKIDLAGVIGVNNQAGKKSLLTILAKDNKGQRFSYVFFIRYLPANSPKVHVATINFVQKTPPFTPPPPVAATPGPPDPNIEYRQTAKYLFAGLKKAVDRGELKDKDTIAKINKYIIAVNQGARFDSAPSFGLDLNLIARLASLGTSEL